TLGLLVEVSITSAHSIVFIGLLPAIKTITPISARLLIVDEEINGGHAAFNAVNYLHELGHQRIGCIAAAHQAILALAAGWVDRYIGQKRSIA
ncbi:hypothetical protein NL343_28190, partial [Klebsiella pneumoniae]|nr:hypothetical protein [Klebsiella pneumoniae]